ncbi:MAG: hypothetical protein U9O64_01720 [Campylobacterota bacterium]|nr:hypothetical protein [Campylobacterota bacterium]
MKNAPIVNAVDQLIEENQERLVTEIFENKENAQNTVSLIKEMLIDYKAKPETHSLEEWLHKQFQKYSTSFENEAEMKKSAHEIVQISTGFDKAYNELEENEKKDVSESKWLGKKIEEGALAANITNITTYANEIDQTLINANDLSFKTYTNLDGSINLNPNLHGFVAENHHVNTFNLSAIENQSDFRARMLEGTGKNSVDIVIDKIEDGAVVRRYQAKYGYDSQATEKYLDHGDYRGQRKLVPDGQEADIKGATSYIEAPDGSRSQSLSYADSQQIKEQIQVDREIKQYQWDGLDKISLTKSVMGETAKMAMFHALFQGGRIFGKNIWNRVNGKKTNSLKEDMQEWFHSSWIGTKNIATQSVVSGAILIAARNGWIKPLQYTPAGKIASFVYVGLQNAKVMYQIGQGKLSVSEGLDRMQRVTLSAVGGLIAAGKGAIVGGGMGGPMGV